MSPTIRLDRLVGRQVYTANNRRLGRLEEFHAEQQGTNWIVFRCSIGASGLAERLGLAARLILGVPRATGYIARWDQIDISDPDRLRITCPINQLQRQGTDGAAPGATP